MAVERSYGHFLKEGNFAKYNNISLNECYAKCHSMKKCESFNMSQEKKECHLNTLRKDKVKSEFFVKRKSFVYYERV